MKDLKRPYDQKEYLKLLEDWTDQTPTRGHAKNFRSRVIKMYALEGEYGTLYKNLYPSLFPYMINQVSGYLHTLLFHACN